MSELCVGLAAPCDPPGVETKLLHYFTEKFGDATSLPFAAFMTHDFQFIHGWSDLRTPAQFDKDLEKVLKSPLVPATEKVAKKLAGLAKEASAAAEKQDWAKVAQTHRKAAGLNGRCEGRDQLELAHQDARDWAQAQFDWVDSSLESVRDVKRAKDVLNAVAKAFDGEPEAGVAKTGLKAVARFASIARMDGERAAKARAKAITEFADTRWSDLFKAKLIRPVRRD